MRSPANQKVIQIELTNACPHNCSNCTRFCGHHKKPYFVTDDHFKAAVASLKEFPRMVGIIGGEPTLHPQFDSLIRHYREEIYEPFPNLEVGRPIEDFGAYRNLRLSDVFRHRRGLWTSLGKRYALHYGLIMDTFPYQCINTHEDAGNTHQALMITREELNVPTPLWTKMRDECWIQNMWSATITPKGAFFCEVAGALDMLFDGPGGWDLEDDWWKRKPEDFGDQLKWCELCAAPLAVPRMQANLHTDIVSPKLHKMLQDIGSPKLKRHPEQVQVFDPAKYTADEFAVVTDSENYLPADKKNAGRVSVRIPLELAPRKIEMVVVCENYDDYLDVALEFNKHQVDEIYVVTSPDDIRTKDCCRRHEVVCVETTRLHENGAPFAKAKAMNDGINSLEHKDWVLVTDADVILPPDFRENLSKMVLNPEVLYYTRRWGPEWDDVKKFVNTLRKNPKQPFAGMFEQWARKTVARITDRIGNDIEHYPYGYFQLFNYSADALAHCRENSAWYDEQYETAENADMYFGRDMFPRGKIRTLPVPKLDVVHLPHGPYMQNWTGRKSPRIDGHAEKELAIVVPFCRLPDSRLYEWLVWNKEFLGKHAVYIVTDRKRLENTDNIRQCILHNMKQYDPAVLRNVGIRTALERGADVVLATDVDCELTSALVGHAAELTDGRMLAPHHMMLAPRMTPASGKRVEPDPRSIGTVALTAADWSRLCGYHEGMEGYGREDGDLYDRARSAGIVAERAQKRVWHHWHESRVDPEWYPANTMKNARTGFQEPWNDPDWGLPNKKERK